MNFAIDIDALRERASERMRLMANAANWLTDTPRYGRESDDTTGHPTDISQLATLATKRGIGWSEVDPKEGGNTAPSSPGPAVSWTDADIERFQSRRDRLMRWGWAEPEAETVAERLVKRDREQDDDRVSCADCRHYRPGRCGNHRHAGLHSPDVGRPLVALLQRCPGFGSNETQGNAS